MAAAAAAVDTLHAKYYQSVNKKKMASLNNPLDGFPSWLGSEESHLPVQETQVGSLDWEAGNGNPLQYSCLENPMDRGAWWATVHGVAKESYVT